MSILPSDAQRRGNPKAVTWFGPSWNAPLCYGGEHVQVPVGSVCFFCGDTFNAISRGVFMWYYPADTSGVRQPVHLACVDHRVAVLDPRHDPRDGRFARREPRGGEYAG